MGEINLEWESWKEISQDAMKRAHWRKLEPHEIDILRKALHSNGVSQFYNFIFQGQETKRAWKILLKLRQMGLLYFTLDDNYKLTHFRKNEWLRKVVDEQWEKNMKWQESKKRIERNWNFKTPE